MSATTGSFLWKMPSHSLVSVVGDLVRVKPKVRGLSKQRALLGCSCVGPQNGIAQRIRYRTVAIDLRKPNARRFVDFGK